MPGDSGEHAADTFIVEAECTYRKNVLLTVHATDALRASWLACALSADVPGRSGPAVRLRSRAGNVDQRHGSQTVDVPALRERVRKGHRVSSFVPPSLADGPMILVGAIDGSGRFVPLPREEIDAQLIAAEEALYPVGQCEFGIKCIQDKKNAKPA